MASFIFPLLIAFLLFLSVFPSFSPHSRSFYSSLFFLFFSFSLSLSPIRSSLVDVFAQVASVATKRNDDNWNNPTFDYNNGKSTPFDTSSFLQSSSPAAMTDTSQNGDPFNNKKNQYHMNGSRSDDYSNVHVGNVTSSNKLTSRNGMSMTSMMPSTAASDESSRSSSGDNHSGMFKKPARLTALESKSKPSGSKLIRNKTATFVRKHE